MADVAPIPSQISPLEGAIVRRYFAASTVIPGDLVYLDTAGKVARSDADALASAQAIGMVVAIGIMGYDTANANDPVDVCLWGPVWVGDTVAMTIPGRIYVSTTAGKFDQTAPAAAGDYPFIAGKAEAASIVFINPQVTIPVVNP